MSGAQAATPTSPGGGLLDNFAKVGRTALFRDAVVHTFEIALSATLGCLVLGFVLALVLAFVAFPGARAARGDRMASVATGLGLHARRLFGASASA